MARRNQLPQMKQSEREGLELQLLQAQTTIEHVRRKLAAPEPVVPWEPRQAPFFLTGEGACTTYDGSGRNGRSFQTRNEAAKASKFFTFYQRLYQLALECNARHEQHAGYAMAYYSPHTKRWIPHTRYTTSCIDNVFNCNESAREACDIMNRDGWVLPTM